MFRCVDLICDQQDKKNLELKTDDIFKKVDATKTVVRASMIDLVDNSEDTPASSEEETSELVIEDDDFELPDEPQENANLGDNQVQQDGLLSFSTQNKKGKKRNKGSK
jgi:hypothetical protein